MIKIIHKNGWFNARHVVNMDNCTFSVVQVDQGKIVVNFTVFLVIVLVPCWCLEGLVLGKKFTISQAPSL